MLKEIVIAAYDKDLTWMSDLDNDIKQTIYRKGVKSDNENEIFLENNVGRCVHTFFNHIYKNYDDLSDITFFAQDYPFDHWGNLLAIINGDMNELDNLATLKIGGYYGFHNNTLGTAWTMPPSKQFGNGTVLSCNSNGSPQDRNPLINVNNYWDILFEDPNPSMYEFIPGGHFAITKEQLHLRSNEFYTKICDLLLEDIAAPWIIERLECYIFNTNFKTKL